MINLKLRNNIYCCVNAGQRNMSNLQLQKFIQQFRALLAIVLLCIITISSFCVMTLSSEKQSVTNLDKLQNLIFHLSAMTRNFSANINDTIIKN